MLIYSGPGVAGDHSTPPDSDNSREKREASMSEAEANTPADDKPQARDKGNKATSKIARPPLNPLPIVDRDPTFEEFSSFPALDEEFDTIGFDYNVEDFEDPNKTPPYGSPMMTLGAPAGAVGSQRSTEAFRPSDLAAAIAEMGLAEDVDEPDLKTLQHGLIGLDLGSSDAVVATFNDDGKAIVVPNAINERMTPARLLRDENGEWLIGTEARSLAPTMPDHYYDDLKSLFLMDGWSTAIGEESHSAGRLLTIFVNRLLDEIRDQVEFEPTHVALAAPVWFKDDQRQALVEAVAHSGLEVVGVTDELLAACVPYSLRLPDLNTRNVVVVDVGHKGTSIAFIECSGGDLHILCQAGLPDLGAVNWDELLIAESVRKFSEHHGFDPRQDPVCMTDLNLRVDQAKKALTQRRYFNMPIQSNGKTLTVRFEREAFERASQSLLRRLGVFLDKAREKGEIDDWSGFEALVITGGGARIPMVRSAIEDTVGRKCEPFNAEENVAIGALYWGVAARHRIANENK